MPQILKMEMISLNLNPREFQLGAIAPGIAPSLERVFSPPEFGASLHKILSGGKRNVNG